ncbi:MAG TPA: amino acid adenylation domain-containing protein, partial [Thermoanaerobaculia bacterium]|nr:amino acid adenylation domain-containing protein [Thermoanaerobaculia bacterium]
MEIPLSYGQRALWFLQRLDHQGSAYNIAAAVRVGSELDIETLGRALEVLSERHEALRASFFEGVDGPAQRIRPNDGALLLVEDLKETGEEILRRRMRVEAERPFDLERDSLLRLGVFRRNNGEHVVLLVIHHIIADLWSLAVLVRELGVVYSALRQGIEPRLSPLSLSYPDAIEGQLRRVEGAAGERLWAYWSERLGGELPVSDLPTDRPRPPVQSFRGSAQSITFDPALLEGLLALGREYRATLFTVLLSAFQTLLHRYSGQRDLVVGSPSAGREAPGLSGMVGYFVNPLPLRTDLSGGPSFAALMTRVREGVLGAFRHQDLPFPLIVERLQPQREPGRSPIFQSMLVLQRAHLPELQDIAAFALGREGARFGMGGLALESMSLERQVSQFDLELMAAEIRQGLGLTLIYDADLFDATTAQRALRHFEVLARSMVDGPDRRIGDLPLLTDLEQEQLLLHWNDSDATLPKGNFPELFEEQVARTPDAVAAEEGDATLTYAGLNARANRLARALLRAGGGPEDRVAVWADRSLDFLTAILAILKTGCAYLPLDPRQPAPRLVQMLERSDCRIVLASADRLEACRAAVEREGQVAPDILPLWDSHLEAFSGENLRAGLTSGRLAYVLYTSGSTGLPKGAMVEHGGMLNHMFAKIRDLGMGPADLLAQTAAPTFDISVWQFLASLLIGGRVRIVPDDVVSDPTLLLREVEARQITVLEVVPSLMRALLDEVDAMGPEARPRLTALRWLIPTGEALPPELCRVWFAHYPGIPLVNAYGPTECSDDVTHHLLTGPPPEGALRTPVGRPVVNMRLYVVDGSLSLLPVGVPGELCVSGVGVGRGYLGDPTRTAMTFVPDPFARVPGSRLYRTGDLGLRRLDGLLEVLGRSDDQVKIRGFRIELGEVEAVLIAHPGVREAVVLARHDRYGSTLLVAYWTARTEAAVGASELREFLRKRLPEAMVPAGFVLLEALPLTPNGKVDRRSLSRIEPVLQGELHADEGSWTPVEEILAGIWEQVLGIERPGRQTSFFEVGGHSLLATRVVSRVREAFLIDLPLRAAFEEPTLAGLAQRIQAYSREASLELPPLRRASRDQPLPLSFAQERLWFLDQMEPGDPWYNMPIAVRLEGDLNVSVLQRALSEVAQRHETLRTSFPVLESGPVQAVLPPKPLEVARLDLTSLPEAERRPGALRAAAEEARRPFVLAAGRLLRASLLRLGEREHVLLLTLHHIIADGWSLAVFVQ